jgi:tetratricopeptide (TPR) repeat protein
MKWLYAVSSILVLALAGCVSEPETGPRSAAQRKWDALAVSDERTLSDKAFSALDKAYELIRTASPDSLKKAAGALGAVELSKSLQANELCGVGRGLYEVLYPEPAPNPFPVEARSEIYGKIFSALKRKAVELPYVEEKDFFSLVLPCLILLDPGAAVSSGDLEFIAQTLRRADAMSGKSSVLPPYLLGLAAEKSGKTADALAFYRESAGRDPSFYPGSIKTADVLSAENKPAEALRILKGLADILPRDVGLAKRTARAALDCGDTQSALDASARIMLAAPEDADGALLRAEAFAEAGNWFQALRVLDTWLAHSPDSVPAILMKARLLAEKGGDPEEAVSILTEAQSRSPKDADILELRAKILLSEGRSNEGISALMQTLELQPDRLSALRLLLDYCIRTRQWLQASSYVAKILAVSDSGRDLEAAYEVAWNLGDFPGAAGYARRLVDKNYGEAPRLLLARALYAQGADAEAGPLVETGLAAAGSPGVRSRYLSLRAVMALPARPADALRDLRASLLADPDNLEALRAISSLLAGQGRYHAALGYLKHAAAISPNDAGLSMEVRDLEEKAEEAPSAP